MGEHAKRMPALFVGHGSPMLALERTGITEELARIGETIVGDFGRPRAILVISAHWFTAGTFVQTDPAPRQIYDMYGFPRELYEVRYPALGCPDLGNRVLDLLGGRAQANDEWGIDHAAWTILVHMLPQADVPVVELSVSRLLDAREAYGIGRALAPLRDEGVLLLGSGNVVHNLGAVLWEAEGGTPQADAFDATVRRAVEARDDEAVLEYRRLPHARYAVPTLDHFLPLAYLLGASVGERPVVFNDVRTLGSLSMTSYAFGMEGARSREQLV